MATATETSTDKKYQKRLLPPALASATPNGPINKHERSPGEQAALEKRKYEVLQSMNKEQIDAAYSGQAVKINEHLQRKAKRNAEIDAQLAQLKAEHDMEMRVIKASLTKKAGEENEDEEEGEEREEGEVEMTG